MAPFEISLPLTDDKKFLHISYEQRWEYLKPAITNLYLGTASISDGPMKMTDLAKFMEQNYSFSAFPRSYKYHLHEWDISKNNRAKDNESIVRAIGKRRHYDISTSNVSIVQGESTKPLDAKKLKRFINEQARRRPPAPQVASGVLSMWNLPYVALAHSLPQADHGPSPFGPSPATPGYLRINSPNADNQGPNQDNPSPNMQLVLQKCLYDRSSLLLQGRFKELLMSCGKEDRITLTNYMHDFYIHSYVTSKYWGKGPRAWTAQMISAFTSSSVDSPASSLSARRSASMPSPHANRLKVPTELCRWAIHIRQPVKYTPIDEPEPEADDLDIQRPESWPEWPEQQTMETSFLASIQNSLERGEFTEDPQDEQPLSGSLVSQALRADRTMGTADAWKFAIMSGNIFTLENLGQNLEDSSSTSDIDAIFPFHTAAAYLDGGNVCCDVFFTLLEQLGLDYPFFHNIDDSGHTILDALVISILRSHSSVAPGHVSVSFRDQNRFPGEEKDICGRWDADSPAIRELFSHGHFRIPKQWKHPFCHSSVQAVCHSAILLFGSFASPNINALSGLFIRRCGVCGLEMKLGPMHVLIMTAYYLAQDGMPGETLFGPLAVLVCLIKLGADFSLATEVSVLDILGLADSEKCYHSQETAFSMMQKLSGDFLMDWGIDCLTGWSCISSIFSFAEQEAANARVQEWESSDGSDDDRDQSTECHCGIHEISKICSKLPKLGKVWSCVQTELLTYRKVEAQDPWISENFSMSSLDCFLNGTTEELSMPFFTRDMMKPHKACGWFLVSGDPPLPVASEVCTSYFMNMDIFSRASYLESSGVVLDELWSSMRAIQNTEGVQQG